jgi:hydrophobic/amphiphilic exporter-1 (mainly G- bacteria), HAE1 family
MNLDQQKNIKVRKDFNYHITKFFISNARLTILGLIFFILFGVFATLSLKTTGFPSPTIPLAIVRTVYPGASSDVVKDKVTVPLEGAVRNVKGVKTVTSQSGNSFSVLSVSIDEAANVESVKSELDSAIRSVSLPTEAEEPKISSPEIGGPDVILAVMTSGNDLKKVYNNYTQIRSALSQIPEISSVEPTKELKNNVIIKLDSEKMSAEGLTIDQVRGKIASFGEKIPSVSNVEIGGKLTSINTSLKNNSLEDLKNLSFTVTPVAVPVQSPTLVQAPQGVPALAGNPVSAPNPVPQAPREVKLSSFAEIDINYDFENSEKSYYSFVYKGGQEAIEKNQVREAVILNIKATSGTDQLSLIKKIEKEISAIEGVEYTTRDTLPDKFNVNDVFVVEAFSQAEDSKQQVDEVVSGLVGSNIKQFGAFGWIGWVVGGIQLVALVMIALVSWRAALISALAIPLSFIFSTITLYLLGESLNTLTLFSLVLVTGLVVDPALVALESIQRKFDIGLRGKEAVLEAIRDVGMGLFLAMLTNIIVFLPFGIITGVFGQIFKYIPLTIIPAIVGSYIVPLVVLSWLGGLILKSNKNTSASEEENLWGISKFLIKLNNRILSSSGWIRGLIIFLLLVIPLSLAGLMFSTGAIKTVQFASSDNVDQLSLNASFLSTLPINQRNSAKDELLQILLSRPEVTAVIPFNAAGGSGSSYYIYLTEKGSRTVSSEQIVNDLQTKIDEKLGRKAPESSRRFDDVFIAGLRTGGGASSFQSTISVKSEDQAALKKASIDVGKTILNACFKDNKVTINPECEDKSKFVELVDDGFTGRQNLVYELELDRDKLIQKQLASLGRGPLTIGVNQALKGQFEISSQKVSSINIEGSVSDVFIKPTKNSFASIDELSEATSKSLRGVSVKDDLGGSFNPTEPATLIQRVNGQTLNNIQVRFKQEFTTNQGLTNQLAEAVDRYYTSREDVEETEQNVLQKAFSAVGLGRREEVQYQGKRKELNLPKDSIGRFSQGRDADASRAFSQLGIALILAIVASYIVLALFFGSFLQPLGILYTIPLTLLGALPALSIFVGGQFGFLEIIGFIILIGIVENVAIFLIDCANQKIEEEGWDDRKAIAYASGVRMRPVLMTTVTTLVSLAPLAAFSEAYRSISVVIIFGIFTSGVISLVTTPILYIAFRRISQWARKKLTKKAH